MAHWLGKDNELPSSSNLTTVALGPWWLSPNAEPFGAKLVALVAASQNALRGCRQAQPWRSTSPPPWGDWVCIAALGDRQERCVRKDR